MGKAGSKPLPIMLRDCTLWKIDRSPACRSVMMSLDALNISLTEVDVDMDKGDSMRDEIVATSSLAFESFKQVEELTIKSSAMNPLKTLPILKDKELILYDSHAINTYLATRYLACTKLLPYDPAGRALIDQLMHYDSGNLQTRYWTAAYPILYEGCSFVIPQHIEDIEYAYVALETKLSGRMWFSGSWLTLGDIAVAATVSTLNVLAPINNQKFPLLSSWLFRMSEQPFYMTANNKGLRDFANILGRIPNKKEYVKCPRSSLSRRSTGGKLAEI